MIFKHNQLNSETFCVYSWKNWHLFHRKQLPLKTGKQDPVGRSACVLCLASTFSIASRGETQIKQNDMQYAQMCVKTNGPKNFKITGVQANMCIKKKYITCV